MPDSFKFPRTLGAIVVLVGGQRLPGFRRRVIDKLVALSRRSTVRHRGRFTRRGPRLLPGLATVIGTLNHLPEPSAGLGRIESVRLNGRAFEMVRFPACEMR